MTTIANPETVVGTAAAATAPKRDRPEGRGRRGLVLNLVLLLGLLLVITPFVWMVLGSFKTTAELRQVPPTWWPESPTTDNYRDLFDRLDFARYFFNSTVVAVAVTLCNLLFCSMLGYALAKLEFPGKRILFVGVIGTLMVPVLVVFMPTFVIISKLNLVNTHLGLILPAAAGAFGVFLMRQFMQGIPDELIEAARVDGASEYRIFFRIVLPLCGPALATLGVLTFLASWNSFLWPLVVASTEEMYTLPVALALFTTGEQESELGLQLAGSLVVVLPIVVLFFALQRFVIQGIATTGIK